MVQPPSPTGLFSSVTCFRSAQRAEYRNTAGQFPARSGQRFSIDLQQQQIQEPRTLPGVFHPGRLANLGSPDHRARRALYAELSVHRRARPGRGLQSRHAGARVSRSGRAATCRPPAAQDELRATAGHRLSRLRTDGVRARVTRWSGSKGGDHHAVHDADVSLSPDGVRTHARQLHPCFHAAEGPTVSPIPLTPRRGSARASSQSIADLGSGYVQQWNASCSANCRATYAGGGYIWVEHHARRHA